MFLKALVLTVEWLIRAYWFFSENILKRKCKHQHDFRVSDHRSCGEVGALRLPLTSLHEECRSPPEEAEAPFLQAAIRVFILLISIRKTTSTKTGEPLYMKNHHCGRVTLKQKSPPSPSPGTRGTKRPFSLLQGPDTGPSLPP